MLLFVKYFFDHHSGGEGHTKVNIFFENCRLVHLTFADMMLLQNQSQYTKVLQWEIFMEFFFKISSSLSEPRILSQHPL